MQSCVTKKYNLTLKHSNETHRYATAGALIQRLPLVGWSVWTRPEWKTCCTCRRWGGGGGEGEKKPDFRRGREKQKGRNIRSRAISRRAGCGGGHGRSGRGLQGLLSAACLLIRLPRGLAWPRKLISGACNTSHPLCWPVQRPTLAATCSPNTNTQAPLWPGPCPAAPTQCTHFGMVHY